MSKINKEIKKLDTKRTNNQIKQGTDLYNKIYINKKNCLILTNKLQIAERHLRKYSTSFAIREMKIKTTLRFHVTPVRLASSEPPMTAYAGKDVG